MRPLGGSRHEEANNLLPVSVSETILKTDLQTGTSIYAKEHHMFVYSSLYIFGFKNVPHKHILAVGLQRLV